MAGKPLLLPLQAEDNRPIRDALGNLVSIPEHAGAFVAAVNHMPLAIQAMDKAAAVIQHARDLAESDEIAALLQDMKQHLNDVARSAESRAKLPAPEEADEEELTALMVNMLDMDIGPGDFAKAIVKKYRVFLK